MVLPAIHTDAMLCLRDGQRGGMVSGVLEFVGHHKYFSVVLVPFQQAVSLGILLRASSIEG
jgi:hypothetical protein